MQHTNKHNEFICSLSNDIFSVTQTTQCQTKEDTVYE